MMVEVTAGLHIGDAQAYESEVQGQLGWAVVHACKDPYHRKLLGYKSPGAPKEHPEYLMAQRGERLYLNLVDADQVRFIPAQIIDRAIEFIGYELDRGHKVLVHCNQGESRRPSIGLLYLVEKGILRKETALEDFMRLYPRYQPRIGMRDFVRQRLAI
jgi:predicted protein tyrosine phosphatase